MTVFMQFKKYIKLTIEFCSELVNELKKAKQRRRQRGGGTGTVVRYLADQNAQSPHDWHRRARQALRFFKVQNVPVWQCAHQVQHRLGRQRQAAGNTGMNESLGASVQRVQQLRILGKTKRKV